jgi:2-amino-4-hydroxy-6-hydroxymethyldihydropteridine diphosphokinase
VKINKIYLGLGSNLGNREENLQIAQRFIAEKFGTIISLSSIYETAAWGLTEQNTFLNQVICIETKLPPIEVLQKVLEIEKFMGRIREQKWGARIIDIDILYYASKVILLPDLEIPHPFIQERRFVLVPLCEIAGEFIHPKFKQTNFELLEKCQDSGEINLFKQ